MCIDNNLPATISEKAIEKASKFLEVIIMPPCEELGLLLQDQVKFWRFKNQVRILNKAEEYLKKKNIKPQKVPLKFIAPLLEYGSFEEEETMQERWAALLAKAADPKYIYKNNLYCLEILKQLSPIEAKVIDAIFEFHPLEYQRFINYKKRDKIIMERTNLEFPDYQVLLSNLLRLGLIEEELNSMSAARAMTNAPRFHTIKSKTELTDIGYLFVRQCKFD